MDANHDDVVRLASTTRLDVLDVSHSADVAAGHDGVQTSSEQHLVVALHEQGIFRRRVMIMGILGLFGMALCIVAAFTVAGDLGIDSDGDGDVIDSNEEGFGQLAIGDVVRKLESAGVSNVSSISGTAGGLSSMFPSATTLRGVACRAPKRGDVCHTAIMWSMMDGVWSKAEWYMGLNASSTFEDFQEFMHRWGLADCAPPCLAQMAMAESPRTISDVRRRRRETDMTACRRRHSGVTDSPGWVCEGDNMVHDHEPAGGYINYYDGNNPLQIKTASPRSSNYFLIIGDWGKAYNFDNDCQQAVANLMKDYAARQKTNGKTLLAIASVGDNFYWQGAQPHMWDKQWERAYGSAKDKNSPLYDIPWIVTLGNHDYGDDDPYSLCPHVKTDAQFIKGQAYGSNQFNKDRNPSRPSWTSNYWVPDYNYHYDVPDANLEFISIDTNAWYVGEYRGGNAAGFRKAREMCGGWHVCKEFLRRIGESGKDLLMKRAREGTAGTVVILQHYPGKCRRAEFMHNLPSNRLGKTKVICAWGHDHEQRCYGKNEEGQCHDVLTGGGGGCCGSGSRGFTAVHLTDDNSFILDMESAEVKLPHNSCPY